MSQNGTPSQVRAVLAFANNTPRLHSIRLVAAHTSKFDDAPRKYMLMVDRLRSAGEEIREMTVMINLDAGEPSGPDKSWKAKITFGVLIEDGEQPRIIEAHYKVGGNPAQPVFQGRYPADCLRWVDVVMDESQITRQFGVISLTGTSHVGVVPVS